MKLIFILMGILKNIRVKSIIKGIAGGTPILSDILANKNEAELNGTPFDWQRLYTSIIIVVVILAFVFGKITMDQVGTILGLALDFVQP